MPFPADLISPGPDDMYIAAAELLEVAAAAVATTRGGEIGRRFVSHGPPVFDCVAGGQLTVHTGGPAVADTFPLQPALQPAHRAVAGLQVNLVAFTVTVVRCYPIMGEQGQTQKLPSIDALGEAAAVMMADCWAIWQNVRQRKRDGTLFPPKERELFMDPAVSIVTSGGAAAWSLLFRTELDGYRAGS